MPFIADTTPATPPNKASEEKIQKQGQEAEEFLKLPWYKQLFTPQFAKEIPSGIAKTASNIVTEAVAKPLVSIAETLPTFLKGKATQNTYQMPFGQPFQSYQSMAETRAGEIVEGKKPLAYALEPFIEVPIAIYGLGQMVKVNIGDIYLTGAPKLATSVPTWVSKSGEIVWESGGKAGQVVQGAIPKYFADKKLQQKYNEAIKVVMEEPQTKLEKQKTLAKGQQEGGAMKEGILKKYVKIPNDSDISAGASTMDIVNKTNSPEKNIQLIQNNVSETSENVYKFLEKNSKYIGGQGLNDLESRLYSMPEPILVKSDASLANARQVVVDTMMDVIRKNGVEDTPALWDSLKDIDNLFQYQFGDKALFGSEKVSALKSLYLDGRKVIQSFIVENTPAAVDDFSFYMNLIHNWKTAQSNIAEKNANIMGTNIFMRLWKKTPFTAKVGGAGGGAFYILYRFLGGGKK